MRIKIIFIALAMLIFACDKSKNISYCQLDGSRIRDYGNGVLFFEYEPEEFYQILQSYLKSDTLEVLFVSKDFIDQPWKKDKIQGYFVLVRDK